MSDAATSHPNISVLSVEATRLGHVRVKLSAGGTIHTVTLPRRLATIDAVQWAGHALAALTALQRPQR